MPVYELTFGSVDRSRLVRNEVERRDCIREVVPSFSSESAPGLVGFALRGDRMRTIVTGEPHGVSRARGVVYRALRRVVRPELLKPAARELHHRAHIVGSLRHYVAPGEDEVEEIPSALTSGSCLPDLVGARRIRGMRLVTAHQLPRLRGRDLLERVGIRGLSPAGDELVRRLGAFRLASAAAFAAGLPVVTRGTDAEVVAARRAVASIGAEAGIARRDVARATGVTLRTARRLAATPPDPALARAVRLRLGMEEALRAKLLGRFDVAGS